MVPPLENILIPKIRIFSQDPWEVVVAPHEENLEAVSVVPGTIQVYTKICA